MCRIEDLTRFIVGQEPLDLLCFGNVHDLHRVGQDEAIHADHDRDGELFGDTERLNVQVSSLLVRLGIEL